MIVTKRTKLCVACILHSSCMAMQPTRPALPVAQEKWRPAPAIPEQALFDETRGNFYYKREYYRKAREAYSTLSQKVDQLDALKNTFFKRRSHADKEVTDFNASLGFEEGRIDELLEELSASLAHEREEMIELTEEERELERQVKEKKQTLEQLKLDLSTLSNIDNALDESIGKVLQTMSKARSYQEKGLESYKAIGQELNDRKAEQLYLSIETDITNVEGLTKYLKNTLEPFIFQKIQELQGLMSKVHTAANKLKGQGVTLSKEIAEQEALDKKRKEEELKKELEAKAKKKVQPKTWWQRFKGWIGGLWAMLFSRSKTASA